MTEPTVHEKAARAWRELCQRQRVYDRLVDQGKMTRQFADKELRLMEAIARDYEKLSESERLL